jgi:hypothetical protein
VGVDIAPGRYYSDPADGCYWERLSGFGGTSGEIIANDFVGFDSRQVIVDIASSDYGFKTDADCGTWFNTPRHGQQSGITPGTWLVGSQLAAGTYRANVQAGCYWERVRDFSGRISAVIANDFVSNAGQQYVTIQSSDTGFSADDDCGGWSRSQALGEGGVTGTASTSSSTIERNQTLNRNQEEARRGRR